MFKIVKRGEAPRGKIAAVEFEGESYGAGFSFFVGDLLPGQGPALHRHPYPEICIVHAGQAAMTIDGREVVAGAGDIVIIEPGSPHSFRAIGADRLEAVAIHAAGRFVIEWLGDRG
jgi:quercetin dioxygenase-like cupin family protein